MSIEMISIEQFTLELLKELGKKSQENKRLGTDDKTIIELSNRKNSGNLTKVELSILNRLLKSKYNVYRTEFDLKQKIEKEKEESRALLRRLRKSDAKSSAERRKERNHRLISYGGLIDVAELGFDDKGAILGALLYAKSALEHNKVEFEKFKQRGDELLAEREALRLQRKR